MTSALAETLDRLTDRSIAKHFYPLRDVNWAEHPITEDWWYMPPESISLYGTAAWNAMDEPMRKRLSLHEFVNACGLALWFENALMRAFLDHLYTLDPDYPNYRYMLIEVGEEVQHNILFAEFIRQSGVPWYSSRAPIHFAGRWAFPWDSRFSRTWMMLAVLIGEEVIEGINRATLSSNVEIHPLAHEVARIHRIEEARHLSYARVYIEENYPKEPAFKQSFMRMVSPMVAWGLSMELARGAVYERVGIPGGRKLFWAARKNPYHRDAIRKVCSRLEDFLTEVDVITPRHRKRWVRLGLLEPHRPSTPREVHV